ncbi:MAG: FAD-dependent monooxygenase, partial [Myxococcales bacterium]|nr:FAD-dependent monooxygenase [Myxococcales bacterium]
MEGSRIQGARVGVVGGGIAGLAVAAALVRRGAVVTVFERAPALRSMGGALVLWTNALHALARLGLAASVRARGVELRHALICNRKGEPLWDLPVGALADELGAPSVAIHRARLLELLAEASDGATLETGARVSSVHERASAARIEFDGRPTAEFDLVIGADGVHSEVRRSLLDDGPPRTAG